MNYAFAYSIGFHPWEDAVSDPAFVGTFRELVEREERGRSAPFGPALDIGTGSGIWAVELAKRGWQVTGVDIVARALDRARNRARAASVDVTLVEGDVTALRNAGISGPYRLVLDTGTFHDFHPAQQRAAGREIDAVAAPDATLLLIAWPRRRRPLIRGVSRDEIEAAFPGWTITDVVPSHFRLPKPVHAIMRPDEHWYRLRRA
jgi:SAM-dependent methyltransferase